MINWIGLKAERDPGNGCVGFINWEECGRILSAVYSNARTDWVCNTDIVVVFRFDELDYLEDFVLHESWVCL